MGRTYVRAATVTITERGGLVREHVTSTKVTTTRLGVFLRSQQNVIVTRWLDQTRALKPARALSDLAILDRLPLVLQRIADLVDSVHTGKSASLGDSPSVHAHDRLARGFDLEHVVAEYAVLRRVIFDTWGEKVGPSIDLSETRRLNDAIDQAIAETSSGFARGRERVLQALDRVSKASFDTADIDTLLHLLAKATLESTEAVETVVVLLRESDRLRVRIAVGLEEEIETKLSLEIGEGFEGTIAKTGEPLFLSNAAEDLLVRSEVIRRQGIRALYGVPLVHHGQVIGVAHMGSRTAKAFSDDDKLLFRSMVARASAVIVNALLVRERELALARERAARDEADRALALLDSLLAASPVGIAFLDRNLKYLRVNAALAALNDRPVAEHIGRSIAEVLPEAAPFLEPLLRKVLETGEPLANMELEASPPSAPKDEPHAFIATYFPVRHGNELVGVGGVVMDVTEQKHTADEKARLAAQVDGERRWVQAILENLPVGVVVAEGETGRVLFFNSRAAELLGRSPGYIGRAEVQDVDGRTIPAPERPLGRAIRGETVVAEHIFLPASPEGPARTLLVNAKSIRDPADHLTAVAALDDVTEARRAEDLQRFLAEASKALAESIEYDAALETIARLAVPHIADWCVVETIEAIDGTSETHARQTLVIAHSDPSMVERVRELRKLYPPHSSLEGGVAAVVRTGRSQLYPTITEEDLTDAAQNAGHLDLGRQLGLRSAMLVPLVARGTIIGAVSFASGASGRSFDEKDLAAAEEFARRAGLALDNARLLHGMRDAVRLREEVLAVVSHDLRNALNSVQVAASLLIEKSAEPSVSRRLHMIVRGANRMNHLIASLLDVASIQAGRLRIEKNPHDVNALVDEGIELAEPLATERHLRLVSQKTATRLEVDCDRERMLQVLSNLLGNAIKFAHADTTVTVSVDVTEREAHVSVADVGPGIRADDLARLFEPYWSAARHATKGTGLGLYIAKSIVEAHGGRIWAESHEGTGSAFHFTLPRG